MGGQCERVRGQSRELLYSIPTTLCKERPRQSLRIGSRTEARGISYMSYFLGRLGRVVHNWTGLPPRGTSRGSTRATRKKRDMPVSSSELYAGRVQKMGHACFQFRTLRGQGPKKWDMPVSSSELYAGRASEGHFLSHFFLSRHALRRRPISRPTWYSATARRLRLRTCS